MAHDLEFLADVEPVITEWRESPAKNANAKRKPHPMLGHVTLAYETGKTVSLPMTVENAKVCSRVVRTLAKRMGPKGSISCNVQVLAADPELETTGRDDVIPLTKLKDESGDASVWLSFKVEDKVADDSETDDSETGAPDVLNPFGTIPAVINP